MFHHGVTENTEYRQELQEMGSDRTANKSKGVMRSRVSFMLFHVVLPLLVGGLIYACWRDNTLPMFRWFEVVGIGPFVQQLRITTAPMQAALPSWFEYSLPDAMWAYALTAFMATVWKGTNFRVRAIWISAGLLLGAGSELGQLAGYVPGSFDASDFLLCVCAAGLALVLTSERIISKRSMNDVAT